MDEREVCEPDHEPDVGQYPAEISQHIDLAVELDEVSTGEPETMDDVKELSESEIEEAEEAGVESEPSLGEPAIEDMDKIYTEDVIEKPAVELSEIIEKEILDEKQDQTISLILSKEASKVESEILPKEIISLEPTELVKDEEIISSHTIIESSGRFDGEGGSHKTTKEIEVAKEVMIIQPLSIERGQRSISPCDEATPSDEEPVSPCQDVAFDIEKVPEVEGTIESYPEGILKSKESEAEEPEQQERVSDEFTFKKVEYVLIVEEKIKPEKEVIPEVEHMLSSVSEPEKPKPLFCESEFEKFQEFSEVPERISHKLIAEKEKEFKVVESEESFEQESTKSTEEPGQEEAEEPVSGKDQELESEEAEPERFYSDPKVEIDEIVGLGMGMIKSEFVSQFPYEELGTISHKPKIDKIDDVDSKSTVGFEVSSSTSHIEVEVQGQEAVKDDDYELEVTEEFVVDKEVEFQIATADRDFSPAVEAEHIKETEITAHELYTSEEAVEVLEEFLVDRTVEFRISEPETDSGSCKENVETPPVEFETVSETVSETDNTYSEKESDGREYEAKSGSSSQYEPQLTKDLDFSTAISTSEPGSPKSPRDKGKKKKSKGSIGIELPILLPIFQKMDKASHTISRHVQSEQLSSRLVSDERDRGIRQEVTESYESKDISADIDFDRAGKHSVGVYECSVKTAEEIDLHKVDTGVFEPDKPHEIVKDTEVPKIDSRDEDLKGSMGSVEGITNIGEVDIKYSEADVITESLEIDVEASPSTCPSTKEPKLEEKSKTSIEFESEKDDQTLSDSETAGSASVLQTAELVSVVSFKPVLSTSIVIDDNLGARYESELAKTIEKQDIEDESDLSHSPTESLTKPREKLPDTIYQPDEMEVTSTELPEEPTSASEEDIFESPPCEQEGSPAYQAEELAITLQEEDLYKELETKQAHYEEKDIASPTEPYVEETGEYPERDGQDVRPMFVEILSPLSDIFDSGSEPYEQLSFDERLTSPETGDEHYYDAPESLDKDRKFQVESEVVEKDEVEVCDETEKDILEGATSPDYGAQSPDEELKERFVGVSVVPKAPLVDILDLVSPEPEKEVSLEKPLSAEEVIVGSVHVETQLPSDEFEQLEIQSQSSDLVEKAEIEDISDAGELSEEEVEELPDNDLDKLSDKTKESKEKSDEDEPVLGAGLSSVTSDKEKLVTQKSEEVPEKGTLENQLGSEEKEYKTDESDRCDLETSSPEVEIRKEFPCYDVSDIQSPSDMVSPSDESVKSEIEEKSERECLKDFGEEESVSSTPEEKSEQEALVSVGVGAVVLGGAIATVDDGQSRELVVTESNDFIPKSDDESVQSVVAEAEGAHISEMVPQTLTDIPDDSIDISEKISAPEEQKEVSEYVEQSVVVAEETKVFIADTMCESAPEISFEVSDEGQSPLSERIAKHEHQVGGLVAPEISIQAASPVTVSPSSDDAYIPEQFSGVVVDELEMERVKEKVKEVAAMEAVEKAAEYVIKEDKPEYAIEELEVETEDIEETLIPNQEESGGIEELPGHLDVHVKHLEASASLEAQRGDSQPPSDIESPEGPVEDGKCYDEDESRPLSPTDYILEPECDAEPEGRIAADTSQQIFIEQSIEASRVSTTTPSEERPPSPSDYMLVPEVGDDTVPEDIKQSQTVESLASETSELSEDEESDDRPPTPPTAPLEPAPDFGKTSPTDDSHPATPFEHRAHSASEEQIPPVSHSPSPVSSEQTQVQTLVHSVDEVTCSSDTLEIQTTVMEHRLQMDSSPQPEPCVEEIVIEEEHLIHASSFEDIYSKAKLEPDVDICEYPTELGDRFDSEHYEPHFAKLPGAQSSSFENLYEETLKESTDIEEKDIDEREKEKLELEAEMELPEKGAAEDEKEYHDSDLEREEEYDQFDEDAFRSYQRPTEATEVTEVKYDHAIDLAIAPEASTHHAPHMSAPVNLKMYSSPIDVTLESGLDMVGQDETVSDSPGDDREALERSQSCEAEHDIDRQSRSSRQRHYSSPDEVLTKKIGDEEMVPIEVKDGDEHLVPADEGELDEATGGDTQTTRILMKKQVHKKTVIRDGKEETIVTEDTHVEQDNEGPEELQDDMQKIINQFMEGGKLGDDPEPDQS